MGAEDARDTCGRCTTPSFAEVTQRCEATSDEDSGIQVHGATHRNVTVRRCHATGVTRCGWVPAKVVYSTHPRAPTRNPSTNPSTLTVTMSPYGSAPASPAALAAGSHRRHLVISF